MHCYCSGAAAWHGATALPAACQACAAAAAQPWRQGMLPAQSVGRDMECSCPASIMSRCPASPLVGRIPWCRPHQRLKNNTIEHLSYVLYKLR